LSTVILSYISNFTGNSGSEKALPCSQCIYEQKSIHEVFI